MEKDRIPRPQFPEGQHYGFIAQEVETILPCLVISNEKGEKSLNYQEVIPILVEAIKAQQHEIEELRNLLNTKSRKE